MKPIKSKEHREIFDVEKKNGKKIKRWIENWDTWKFLGYSDDVEAECDIIPFEKLRDDYEVGMTKVVRTVRRIEEGGRPREIFYPTISPVPFRKMCILGTCLPNTPVEHMKSLGFTHFIGNREGWPDHINIEANGVKIFINIHPYDHSVPSNEWIKEKVIEFKDKDWCGGFWSDSAGGEEPDARAKTPREAEQCLLDRIRFKEEVRKFAPDSIRWPIVEQFDLTEEGVVGGLWRPGWKNMYDEKTLDILLFDCYVFDESDQKMKDDIRIFYDRFPGKYCKGIQVIPQLNAFKYRAGSMWTAYNAWKECLGKPIAVAFYKDETVRQNEDMQREIAEINREVMS